MEPHRKGGAGMDVGSKIKQARLDARLTQEYAAQELGVSRQTISNWENGRTYPDIVSVIRMSELYRVSLDHLLKGKEERPMEDYIEYLEESTNMVQSHKKLSLTILIALYLGIWAFALIVFWFFISGADAMGYSLVFLWIILPVTTLVISGFIGRNNHMGKWKWLAPPAFGTMHMLAEYATFSTANMILNEFSRLNPPMLELLFLGAAISLIGLGTGCLIRRIKRNA